MKYTCGVVKMCLILLPWRLRRVLLNHIFGYEISPKAHIGFSYIYPKYLKMADGSKINHKVIALHLDKIEMGTNTSIGRGCWITGFPIGSKSKHFSHDTKRKSELILGNDSAITKNHHIDCTNSVHIGSYVTIAGYNSQLLTHSIDVYENRQDSHPIEIGDYCFVSTGVTILGGSKLPAHSVLGAGAVLNKMYDKEYFLYGGVPAKPIKEIPQSAKYFIRKEGYVW